MEILYAFDHTDAIVVVVVPEGARVSPWLRYHSETVMHTLEEVAEWIRMSFLARYNPQPAVDPSGEDV
jgi:hypothetical protein